LDDEDQKIKRRIIFIVMNLELSPEERKAINQFFVFIKSNGADVAWIDANFEYGDPAYISGMRGDNGRAIPVFQPVAPIIEKIINDIDTDDFESEFQDSDVEYFNVEINFDSTQKKLTVECNYSTPGEEEAFDESDIDDMDIFKEYTDKGVSEIICSYNGGGDSGYIDSDMSVDGERENVPAFLEDVCYDALSNFGGWEINEGSQGNIVFNLVDKTRTVNHTWNTEENHSFNLIEMQF
jgi:hypothetical protein